MAAKRSSIIVEQSQLSSDPASPASGFSILYPKTDGKWYLKNSDGIVQQVGEVNLFVGDGLSGDGSAASPLDLTLTTTGTSGAATLAAGVLNIPQYTPADDSITNAKLANVATSTIKGRVSASTGDPEDLTASQVKTLLAVSDADLATTDVTTNNVTSTKHGFTPKSPADATKFLNGAATPAYANVLDSDLSTSDITTNNFTTSKHGFVPKGTNLGKFLKDDGSWSFRQEVFTIACSDLTTALTTGTNKAYFRMPYAGTLNAVRGSLLTAPTGSTLVVDVNESGTTVLSTKLSFDISEKTTTTAATAAVISDSALADDAEITIDIDQVGSTIAGAGLVVYLYITKT